MRLRLSQPKPIRKKWLGIFDCKGPDATKPKRVEYQQRDFFDPRWPKYRLVNLINIVAFSTLELMATNSHFAFSGHWLFYLH